MLRAAIQGRCGKQRSRGVLEMEQQEMLQVRVEEHELVGGIVLG